MISDLREGLLKFRNPEFYFVGNSNSPLIVPKSKVLFCWKFEQSSYSSEIQGIILLEFEQSSYNSEIQGIILLEFEQSSYNSEIKALFCWNSNWPLNTEIQGIILLEFELASYNSEIQSIIIWKGSKILRPFWF
ncbi:hypothetical protein CEXT_403911 [Caerostris extrusa]|uniref:Uncharacterized protein n=1 Tax=Caerostris extrusa TaxID=172846 RepID=A0AAV4RNW3_CAEEX|nr:hypothetical protein CEXT_403911 [Caerostris extrusa]